MRSLGPLLFYYTKILCASMWIADDVDDCFCDAYGWFPNLYDIRHHVERTPVPAAHPSSTWRSSSSIDNSACCFRAKHFSAHVRPSKTALRHDSFFVSLIYEYATRFVCAHGSREDASSQEEGQSQQSPQRGRHALTHLRDHAGEHLRAAEERERKQRRRRREEGGSACSRPSISSAEEADPSVITRRHRSPSIYREMEDARGAGRPFSRFTPGDATADTPSASQTSSSRVRDGDSHSKRRRH